MKLGKEGKFRWMTREFPQPKGKNIWPNVRRQHTLCKTQQLNKNSERKTTCRKLSPNKRNKLMDRIGSDPLIFHWLTPHAGFYLLLHSRERKQREFGSGSSCLFDGIREVRIRKKNHSKENFAEIALRLNQSEFFGFWILFWNCGGY